MSFRYWLENTSVERKRPVSPGYRTLYHGTILSKYNQIVSTGKISSWGSDNEGIEKTSTGDMYEGGLIWFFDSKDYALSYAKGREFQVREIPFASGGIVEVDVPKSLYLVDRYKKLDKEEADKLIPYYPKHQQSYKPIKEGLELGFAVSRLWTYTKMNFGQVLKILDIDGIIYDDIQIGIAVKELSIVAATLV